MTINNPQEVRQILLIIACNIMLQEKLTIKQMIERWQSYGLHHRMLEELVPCADNLEGDEYAAALDEFENEFIGDLEKSMEGP